MECLWLLTILVRKGVGDHGVEAILSEFRALLATTKLLEFYSFQRSWIQRPQLSRPEEEPKALHLTQGISSVSDTYLHSVLDAWYFSGIERYMLLWFEQHCPFDSVLTDHHCKYTSRLMHDNDRLLPNVYKGMNKWGGIVISVFR
jgi:hypothetical protein